MATKLLVADDSLTIQKIIRLALSNQGYEIQTVSDGQEALLQISMFKPEIMLVDMSLPGKDAFELAREIHALGPDYANLKTILLSSISEPVDEVKSAIAGFHGRLLKPFDPATLRRVLSDVASGLGATPASAPASNLNPPQGDRPEVRTAAPRPPALPSAEENVSAPARPPVLPPAGPPRFAPPPSSGSGPNSIPPPLPTPGAIQTPAVPSFAPPSAPPNFSPPPLPPALKPNPPPLDPPGSRSTGSGTIGDPIKLPEMRDEPSMILTAEPEQKIVSDADFPFPTPEPYFNEQPEPVFSPPPAPPASYSEPPSFSETPSAYDDDPIEVEDPSTLELSSPAPPMDYSDIKQLTESTIRMSGLDEFSWSVQESGKRNDSESPTPPFPSSSPQRGMEPPDILSDSGSSDFPLTRTSVSTPDFGPTRTFNPGTRTDFDAPPPPPPSSSSDYFSPPGMDGQPLPISSDHLESLIQKQIESALERIAQQVLPDIAEKVIKQEIRKMLLEQGGG